MSDLLQFQFRFSRYLGRLLVYADDTGIRLTMGECYRTPQQAAWNAAHDLGIQNSLHQVRLAVDVQIFLEKGGAWVYADRGTEPEYKLLANYWKSLDPLCCWGGDFTHSPDWDHYSLMWNGRK